MTDHTIGIDISKLHLDVFDNARSESAQFEKSSKGFRQLEKWLKPHSISLVVYEATGPYHLDFEEWFCDKLPLAKVNPLQARRFAQACGTRAKTDRLDAQGLARMGAAIDLEPDTPISKTTRVLKELQVARSSLVKERVRLKNQMQVQSNSVLKRLTKSRMVLLNKQIEELDHEISGLIAEDAPMQRKREILKSIPGLGSIASAAILTYCPEVGSLGRKQISSLAGLAPHSRESGQWKGKTFISGGRKPLRDALYMPAIVAMRFNPDLAAKYGALRRAGKPAKVAIVAIMRKLIETANALIKNNRKWEKIRP